jgi:hypothetical protein
MKEVLKLENESLKFVVREDCSAEITDKRNGAAWRMGPVAFQDKSAIAEEVVWNRRERVWADYYMGRFRAESTPQGLKVAVLGPPWTEPRGVFLARWTLEGRTLELRVEEISEELQSLCYPPPIESASIVWPANVGSWIREPQPGMTCEFATQNNGLNMRWVGGMAVDAERGWMMIFEDGYEDSGVYRNSMSVTPAWLKSKDRWGATRSVRYHFTDNGYVGQAKTFRKYMLDNRLFRTLREKIDQTPKLACMLGGRTVSFFQCCTEHARSAEDFMRPVSDDARAHDGKLDVRVTHADVAEAMRLAKKWGMKKGVFNLRGTFHGGYDENHPDIWPPEPALGTLDELKVNIASEGDYLVVLHDNYQDMYQRVPSFPNGLMETSSSRLLWGGYWHGGLCFITCSTEQVRYARRNWEQLKTLGLEGHFIDTAACVQFYECHNTGHPTDRAGDRQAKQNLMQFYKDQGLVLGSEEAADFGLYHIDFLENRNTHKPRTSAPLWPLVFHDAAFYTRYSSAGTSGGDPARQLENYLWGYTCYWPVNTLEDFKTHEQAFKESLALDEFHARVGLDEMVTHRYLCEDDMVEQTEFESGVSVIANFADEPRTVEGKTVPAKGHLILEG